MKKIELADTFKHLDRRDRDFLLSSAPSKLLNVQDAKLRLEFLKENFDFIDFFSKLQSNPKDYLTINETIKKVYPSTRKTTPLFSRGSGNTKKYLGDYFNMFGLNPQIEKILWFLGCPFPDFLALFDPQKTFEDVTNEDIKNALPIILTPCGIRRGTIPGYPISFVYGSEDLIPDTNVDSQQLAPYEHLLIVDMRKRKSQLIDEFKQYIENEYNIKSTSGAKNRLIYKSDKTYESWEPTTERLRKEAEVQLQVWRMRKERWGYAEIGKKLSMNTDAARKAFYKAFERSQGRPFDVQSSHELLKDIEVSPPANNCTNCPDKATCVDLCPTVLGFMEQDEISSRQKILAVGKDENYNNKVDYLYNKNTEESDNLIKIKDFDGEIISMEENPSED